MADNGLPRPNRCRRAPGSASARRIPLTGCPSGGVVVCLDDCSGEGANRLLVDEDADDILRAIAERYFAIDPTARS